MKQSIHALLAALLVVLVAPLMALVTSSPAEAYPRHCYAVRSPGESQSHGECYRLIRRVTPDYKVGYRDSLVNDTGRTAQIDCEASYSKTFTMGASLTMSAEIKAGVFANIKAETSVSMSKSMTSGISVKASVSVPARTTTYCDRVVYRERFRVEKCLKYHGQIGSCKIFTFWGPSRRGWRLHDAP